MKEVRSKIEQLQEEISAIEDSKYQNIFNGLLSIIEDISDSIEEIDYKQDTLEENIKYIDEDIIGLQDELFEEVCRYVFEQGTASTSSIQRRYKIGYNRAARLVDMLERHGFVSEQRGSKPREVFMTESDIISMFE